MQNKILQFTKDELFIEKYFEETGNKSYVLKEEEDSGKSTLEVMCNSECSLCIRNLDSKEKNVNLSFFRTGSKLGLCKRVDHIVFEQISEEQWNAHLIEMKSGIENLEKWYDIKGKFRASYFIVRAMVAILHIEIKTFYFYTTYEHANILTRETNISSRKVRTGEKIVNPKDEWEKGYIMMNLGEKIRFDHFPVEMKRIDGILEGKLQLRKG